jgi:Fe-S-cluster containining protein
MESCNCNECISACRNDPGRLVPEDMKKLSTLFKVPEEDLIKKYLIKVPVSCNGHIIYALSPAKKKGHRFISEPGTIAPDYYISEKGRCIFLDDNGLCTVHEAKPFECSAYMGCRNTFLGKPYRPRTVEEFFYKRWKSRQIDQ